MQGALKFNRAQAHLAELRRLLDEYRGQAADALFVVSTAQDGSIEYRRADLPPLPAEIGVVFGDFLQTPRASLDHAVYVISTAIHPQFERTGFPIALNEKVYGEAAEKSLACVPDEVRAAVRQCQPFVTGAGADDPLWQLHDMARIDRHREITLLASVVATKGVGWVGTVRPEGFPDIRIYSPAVSAGELLCRVPSREQEPFRNFTPDIGVSVVFGEGDRLSERQEVFGLTTEIRSRVWTVLLELDRIADQLLLPVERQSEVSG